ncbi:MAG: hypothetical protein L6W00_13915 [Lentisphaeria bacterium]|nr:MAG: hypothetical protein L6W00_13915 [Lentisphaeria bacterium]
MARFLDALRTPPFLCDSKLVWLRHFRDLELFSAKEPDDGVAGVLEILSNPLPPELSVLIDGGGLDQREILRQSDEERRCRSGGAQCGESDRPPVCRRAPGEVCAISAASWGSRSIRPPPSSSPRPSAGIPDFSATSWRNCAAMSERPPSSRWPIAARCAAALRRR